METRARLLEFLSTLTILHKSCIVSLTASKMADEVKIDSQTFHTRLSSLTQAWKTDRRSGDALFAGVGSIVVLMGKNEEAASYHKSNAMHVRIPWQIPRATHD